MRRYLCVFFLTFASLAFGEAIDGPAQSQAEPKAVMNAPLVQLDQDGKIISAPTIYDLTLYKIGEHPISFQLDQKPNCAEGDICPQFIVTTSYRILNTEETDCGSVRYYAVTADKTQIMTVLDHTRRACNDSQPYQWAVQLQNSSGGEKMLYGNPEPIDDETDCQSYVQNTLCDMIYMPATCQVSSIDGQPVQPTISENGVNACFAAANVKASVCERGFDPELLQEDEIVCTPAAPKSCPVPECAAPPANCRYVANSAPKDASGCPVGCGALLCVAPAN